MDPFATLGLPRRFDLDREQLERKYRDLQRALHPDRHTAAPPAERRLTLLKAVEVNEAYRKLKDELSRAEALISLAQDAGVAAEETKADPAFLMEMMELRESLGDAKAAGDRQRVGALAEHVQAMRKASRAALLEAFEAPGAPNWAGVREHVGRLKYFARFLDEVHVFEEESV